MKEGFVCISYLLSQGLAITANIISCFYCHIQLVNLFIYQLLSYYHNTGISFPDFLLSYEQHQTEVKGKNKRCFDHI